MPVRLTREQDAAVHDRGGGLLVSAAAGSGKTRVLVERLLSRVEEGADLDRFLAITYTRAAAAELRGRIVAELSERLAQRPGDAFLRRQATLVYQAQISTVHAFCAQFLREEGHRLDLDADFRLCDEGEAQVLMTEALDEVLEARYEGIETDPDFAFLVDTMSAGRDDARLVQIVLDIRGRIQSHPDPDRWLTEQEEVFALRGVTDAGDTPWGRLLLEDAGAQADHWALRMEQALDLCRGEEKLEKGYAPSLAVTLAGLRALSAAARQGWDAAVAAMGRVEFPRLGAVRGCSDPAAQERIRALRDGCKKRMEKLSGLLGEESAGLLEDMRAVWPAIRGLFALVRDFDRAFSKAKADRRMLDFSDLEHKTAQLLIGPDGAPTETARRWAARYDEVMVDEYQDTNAVQDAIFDALTLGGRDLFVVGDVKQSIYRFRLADPTIFLAKYRAYPPLEEAAEGERRRIELTRNFRSRPQILEGANYLFRSLMNERSGELDYDDAQALVPGGQFPESGADLRVELDALDASLPDWEEGEAPARDLLEARYVARRARELMDAAFPVPDGEGGLRPVRWSDMVILLRSPNTSLHHYAAALGELDIPWSAEGGEDFFAATEIQAALSLLRAIDNPRQDVALIGALRSAVYGFSADRLSQIRVLAPEEDLYTALSLDEGEDARAFLADLADLRRRSVDMSCEDLFWLLCDRTDLLGIYAALDEGEKRRGNLLALAQLARGFEQAGHKGLFGFLGYLRRLEESGGQIVPPSGKAGAGVRILSIHRAKGLEFPVVFLAGLARQFNRQDQARPILFHPKLGVGPKRLDRERMVEWPTLARLAVGRQMDREMGAEELRLLYVAATRAQEKLIMTVALTGGRRDIQRLLPDAGAPVEPQALLDAQSPGQWVLLAALARPEAACLRQGDHVPPPQVELGPAWDIRWVDAAPLAQAPRRPHRPARPETAESAADADRLRERFAWTYPHAGDVEVPSKLTATQLKGRELDQESAEGSPPQQRPLPLRRPRFAGERLGLTPTERGTALHLVMQYIDFMKCGSEAEIAAEIARLVEARFITPEQGAAVEPARIARFFASDLGREMMAAPKLRREFKFSLLVPAARWYPQAGSEEEILLQGVVDCCFEDADGVTVIDFKTDHVFGDALLERAESYRPQIEAYAQALERILGRPVRRKVLWAFSEGRAIEL